MSVSRKHFFGIRNPLKLRQTSEFRVFLIVQANEFSVSRFRMDVMPWRRNIEGTAETINEGQ
jgi:hypothetical protein